MKALHFGWLSAGITLFLILKVGAQEAWVNKYPPTVFPDRVVLNITEDPATTLAISWRTDQQIRDGEVEIMEVTADPREVTKAHKHEAESSPFQIGPITATYHAVTVPDLSPNTDYMYRVGTGEYWSEWFHTTTAGKVGEKMGFIYLGDVQAGIRTLWPRVIREAYTRMPDARLIMYAGDIVNRGNDDEEWGDLFYGGAFIHSTIPSMPSPGNHEYARTGEALSALWKPQFNLPLNGPEGLEETAYYADVQGVRFISINSYRVEESDTDLEKQREWVRSLLKDNPNKWTIVTYHHPFYSIRPTRDNKRMRDTFKPLFDQYKVDLVLQGHDHAYARGRQKIEGPTKGRDNGTVYVLSVSGSKMSSMFEGKWADVSATYTQLYQLIRIDGDRLWYEAYTAAGKLHDSFTLQKNGNDINTLIQTFPK